MTPNHQNKPTNQPLLKACLPCIVPVTGGGNSLIINKYALKTLCFSLLLWLTPHLAKAQTWEVVPNSAIDFSGGLPASPPFYQAGFLLMGSGASGNTQDNCVGVLNFQSTHYVAVQATLSDAYEYRFSWNVRTITPGKQLQYQIGSVPGSAGTNIGNAQNIPFVSAFSQPADDLQSAVFGGYNGDYYLIVRRSGGGSAPQVRFDNFKLERRLIAPPVLAFQQSNVSIAEGGSTQVCISVTTPSVASTADVVLSSDDAPHLIDFTTQTLTFPINSTTAQCFTLQLEPVNGIHDQNHIYTLELQNLTGGATPGTPSSLTVTVTDDVPNPPAIEFQEPEITIAEGGSTSVCISVTTPSSGFTADVVLISNADPHFTNFTTRTLSFPAGSTSAQCFTLELEPANGIVDQNHTYTFELQNLTGSATLGTASSLTVTATDDVSNNPVIEFEEPEITIAEGGSTEVCVSLANPSAGFTIDVVLTSAANPHFTNFTTKTLTFPAGSASQQCFTLELEPANGIVDQNHTYTFELQNPTGGVTIVVTNSFTVTVTDDMLPPPADCPWAGADKTICTGSSTTIGCPLPAGSDEDHLCFSWFPTSGLDDPSSLSTTAHPSETTEYFLYVTDDQGHLHAIDQVLVTVHIPEFLLLKPNPAFVCNNMPVTLSAFGNFTSFMWSNGVSGATNVVSAPGVYSVTATSEDGCIVEDALTVQTFDFEVQIQPENPVFCGDPVELEVTTNAEVVSWYIDGGLQAYGNEYTVYEPVSLEVILTGEGGCTESRFIDIGTSITDVETFPLHPAICGEAPLTLSAANGFSTYRWYDFNEDGALLSNSQTVEVTAASTYYLEVTDANGCVFGKSIDVIDSPAIAAQIIADYPSVCYQIPGFSAPSALEKNAANCSNASSVLDAGAGYASYLWSNGSTASTLEVTSPGLYSVTITDAFGCSATPEPFQVSACTEPAYAFSPETMPFISCAVPGTLTVGTGFASYLWSDGSTQETLVTGVSGLYAVTVTDQNGCQATQQFYFEIADPNAEVDLEIFKPAILAGNTTTQVIDEDGIGAMTFVNADNDDNDNKFDLEDKDVIGGDNELMRIRLKLNPASMSTRAVKLTAASGGDFIKVWRSNTKKEGEYTLGTLLELTTQEGGFYVIDLWVEGIAAHTSQKETVLMLECAGTDAANCLEKDFVSLTIVGLNSLTWKGRSNGFDGGTNQSNTLDTNDPNFPQNIRNQDNSLIKSYRVFPDARFISVLPPTAPPMLTPRQDMAELCITLSVAPPEPIVLHLKAFDVDDPSESRGPVDPNDKQTAPGVYTTTDNPGSPFYGPSLKYDKNNDNRGPIFKAPVSPCPFGVMEGDTDLDGLLELTFPAGENVQNLGFKVSLHPGDNYRVAGTFDPAMPPRLHNEDGKHDVHIHDEKAGRLVLDAAMVSPVLTVWRLFNVEVATMRNLQGNENKVKAWISDFDGQGGKASRATKLIINEAVYDLEAPDPPIITNLRGLEEHFGPVADNPPSLDLNSVPPGKGRFENGFFSLGTNGIHVGDIKANGNNYIDIKGAVALPGSWMTFTLSPAPSMDITGYVQEIQKNTDGTFTFTLQVVNGTLNGVGAGASFHVSEGNPMTVTNVDLIANTVTTPSLSLLTWLSDDDRQATDNVLPYDWTGDPLSLKSGLAIFKDAYLEPVIHIASTANDIGFRSNIATPTSFNTWLRSTSSYFPAEGNMGDKEGVWVGMVIIGWQAGLWRKEGDPDSENDLLTLGVTLSESSNLSMMEGGHVSAIPLESFRDRFSGNSGNSWIPYSVAHELGHQFGLDHIDVDNTFMHSDLLKNSLTALESQQRNYIRCRKSSPGTYPSFP